VQPLLSTSDVWQKNLCSNHELSVIDLFQYCFVLLQNWKNFIWIRTYRLWSKIDHWFGPFFKGWGWALVRFGLQYQRTWPPSSNSNSQCQLQNSCTTKNLLQWTNSNISAMRFRRFDRAIWCYRRNFFTWSGTVHLQ